MLMFKKQFKYDSKNPDLGWRKINLFKPVFPNVPF